MADAGFFRGTSAAQDNRFSDKEKKMMKQMKFADSLVKKVDMPRVKLDVIKPWITRRVTEMLGAEDEVLVEFVFNQLEEKNLNPRKMQINLTGFLNGKNARVFMQELWDLLCSASANPNGIPDCFIEQKKEEIKKRNEEQAHQEQLIRRQLEAERERVERQLSCAVRHSPVPTGRGSPAREERRQRRRSRSEPRDHGGRPSPQPHTTAGHGRDPGRTAAVPELNTGPAAAGGDGTRRAERTADGTRAEGDTGTALGEADPGRSETAQRKRSHRSGVQDSEDSNRKPAGSRTRRSSSRSRETRWNRSRSGDGRRSRSRSRDRYRSRSRDSRSRSPEPRRQTERRSRRRPSAAGRDLSRSRRSSRRRSSSRERWRTDKSRSSRSSAGRAVSPPDGGRSRGRPDARRLSPEDREDRSSRRKRRAASDDEIEVDKKKDKKKKKKKHSKKHKKHKSRKRSRSSSKDNEPEETKDTRSRKRPAAAAGDSEGAGPPVRRDGAAVIVKTVRRGSEASDGDAAADVSDTNSTGAAGSSPESENNAASPATRGAERRSPEESENDASSSEDEQDLEALEKKLRERALRSMQRRQEIKTVMPPARASPSQSSTSSTDSE